jgi:hypothetical protein
MNNSDKPKQLEFADTSKKLLIDWAKRGNINLINVDFVIPFVLTDKSMSVWLFFDTDKNIQKFEQTGITKMVKDKYLNILSELDYPEDYLSEVTFIIDSEENVKQNYEGSYFYRLR